MLSIDGLITGLIAFFFGIVVLIKNKKNVINQTLFLLTLATAWWAFSYWRWLSVYDNRELALFWTRLLSIGSVLIPLFYFHWIVSLLKLNQKKIKLIILSYFVVLLFLFFSFSPLFVKEVTPILHFAFWPKAGPLYSLYLFFVYFGLVFYSIYLLLKHYKQSKGLKRVQIKYVLLGSILGFGGGATNFFLWYGIDILPLGNVLVVSYPILFSYSIVVHRLMDIKFVLRRSFVYLASLSTILIFAISAQYAFERFFMEISVWAEFAILILSVSAFPIISKAYYRLANKYFFTSLYDSQKVIMDLSDNLRSTLELKKIYKFISDTFLNSFHAKSSAVFLYNEKSGKYAAEHNRGFNLRKKRKLAALKQLRKLSITQNESIIIEELRHSSYKKYKAAINMLDGLGIEILTPLNIKDKNIGFIALGRKESADIYNNEDLQVLKIIGAQAAIAVENAILYEEAKKFNIKLKKEIRQATAELRAANINLKRLDVAKSEFISIASHQLRTPLTVIKGYISMVLEGTFGKLNQEEFDSLKKAYESNERLIKLVENLLNISRVESGRLKFDFLEARLEKIAGNVVEELSAEARAKGLALNYQQPSKPLPKITLDEGKIRQVILNLIDNSIKYTKKGSINVSLEQINDNIQFCVSDTGMGITEDDLPKLFKKFSRGKDTPLVHAGGSGLGLYVCKMMVEAHSGKVWCESKGKGKGAKFCFRLPIK